MTDDESPVVEEKKAKTAKPTWVKMKSEELTKLVVDLAKKGESPAKIGLILRDQYGVPKSKLFGKRITQILDEAGVKYIIEKDRVDGKVSNLKRHLEKNKHDYGASRALTKKLWDIYHLERA
jgi:small subunit ribosomal protein S15